MTLFEQATLCYVITITCILASVSSYALNVKDVNKFVGIRMEPNEAIVFPGDNVTFTCYYSSNSTFIWDFTSMIQNYDVIEGSSRSEDSIIYYSRLTVYLSTRLMSGEITCSVESGQSKAIAFLIVNGVGNGASCQTSSDCRTDKAVCQNGICECPTNYVRLRLKDRGYDVCREMIYSLYDPCEYDEQCAHFVDPRSICKSVCVCAPWARDRKGRCVSISEIAYSRSQEMYRVGLIAVTCIIILIVAVSLWVTLRRFRNMFASARSCGGRSSSIHRRSFTRSDPDFLNGISTEIPSDKPPSYDDISEDPRDTVGSPPNFKEALKHCMTAKKLTRQVSAPAGQLLSTPPVNHDLKLEDKTIKEL